jgi:hypothetical protein
MSGVRVDTLLDAYFNYPLHEYVRVISSVKELGGLSPEERQLVEKRTTPIHASTILRHINDANVSEQDFRLMRS